MMVIVFPENLILTFISFCFLEQGITLQTLVLSTTYKGRLASVCMSFIDIQTVIATYMYFYILLKLTVLPSDCGTLY